MEHPIQQDAEMALIDKMLLEKVPQVGIARVTGLSERWLKVSVKGKYEAVPRVVRDMAKTSFDLTIKCDEAWSFVGNKENIHWIWLAAGSGNSGSCGRLQRPRRALGFVALSLS
jgi:hypothetical protein